MITNKKLIDTIDKPSHYQGRYGEDLKKARKNLNWLIESLEDKC